MTTVVKTLQARESPLGDPACTGEVDTAVGRARWRVHGEAGPVVLLVEGADDLNGWPPALIVALVARGLRVLSYETDGSPPTGPVAGAGVALDVLDGAGVDRAHVVAASAGGLAAQALAALHAQRVRSMCLLMTRLPTEDRREIDAAVLHRLGPGHPESTPAEARAVAITRHAVALSLLSAGRPGHRTRARRRATLALERGTDPIAALLAFARGEDGTEHTPIVGLPVIVVHGRDDPIVTAHDAVALAERYAAPIVVPRSGHDLPWGVEEKVADQVGGLALRPTERQVVRRQPRWGLRVGLAALVLTVLVGAGLIAASTISVPYYAIRPGTTRQTNDLVVIPAGKRIAPTGQVLFVTVGVQQLRALQYLIAARDPDVDIVPEEALLGKANPKEYAQRSTQAMVDSKETAAVVALRRLCLSVPEKGTGARIEQVSTGSPAERAGMKAEDTIIGIGDTTVNTADQALEPLRALKPGAPFSLRVVGPADGDQQRTVTGTLAANPRDSSRSFLGVVLRTRAQDFTLPFDVGVESGKVGGPSAGLAFTLALLDQLTAGELTGGGKVAATGTIELDGSVGQVGGVPQKAVAVRRSGAKLFLVPSAELAEAKAKIGPSVEVVPVDTLEQALAALAAHGGDVSGIPTSCPGS